MSKSYIPTLGAYNSIGTFPYWCSKVLPTVYDDSLSYYELLCKVVNSLKEVVKNGDTTIKNIDELYKAFVSLKDYVDNYFEDVDESVIVGAVDKWFDEHPDMTEEVKNNYVTPQMFGAVGDGVTDDSVAFQSAIANSNNIYVPTGTYLINDVKLRSNVKIWGENRKSIIKTNNDYDARAFVYENTTDFVELYNLTFTGCGVAISYINKEDYHFLSTAHISHCHFFADLTCCIRANLILSTVEHCTFGYFGNHNQSGNHTHIEVVTTITGSGNATFNRFVRNRFYRATVCSCRFEGVRHLYFDGNNWEQNKSEKYTIILKGCFGHSFRNNWFEYNGCDYEIYTGLDDESIYSAYVQLFEHNYIQADNNLKAFIESQGCTSIQFYCNMGNLHGAKISKSAWDNDTFNLVGVYHSNYIHEIGGTAPSTQLGVKMSFSCNGLNTNPWFKDFSYEENAEGWKEGGYVNLSSGALADSLGNGMQINTSNSGYNYFYKSFPVWYLRGKRIVVKAIGKRESTDGADALRLGYNFTDSNPPMLSGASSSAITSNTYEQITATLLVPNDANFVHLGLYCGGTNQVVNLAAFDVFICDNDMIDPCL